MMNTTIRIFVYGTLLKGCANDISRKYGNVCYKGTAVITGALYELEGLPYPGVLLNDPERKVKGEVYEADETILYGLDKFEGYDPADEENSFYFRKEITVFLKDTETNCYIYELNKEKYRLGQIIESGDWKQFIEHNPSLLKRKENWPVNLKDGP